MASLWAWDTCTTCRWAGPCSCSTCTSIPTISTTGRRPRSTSTRSWRTSTGTRLTDAWSARSARGWRRTTERIDVKWGTRQKIRVNRTATAWLIRRFIDPAASFLFVEPEQVAEVQRREGATGFDAPGATYPHMDDVGRCSFEALVDEYRPGDVALRVLAQIVR